MSGPELDYESRVRLLQEGDMICDLLDGLKGLGVSWVNSLLIGHGELPDCLNLVRAFLCRSTEFGERWFSLIPYVSENGRGALKRLA